MAGYERVAYVVTPHNGNSVARVEVYSHSPGWPDIAPELLSALQQYADAVGGQVHQYVRCRP